MVRLVKDGRGISEALVSVVLFAMVVTICVSAIAYAQLNLAMQSEQTEFENAKSSMINLAETIESLSVSGKGAAAYVRISSKTGGIWFTKESGTLKITVGGETREYDVNLIRFRSNVPSADFQVFKGVLNFKPVECLIVDQDSSAPLGWVYLNRSLGAHVVVDFGRVRVVPTGLVNNGDNKYYLVDVAYVKITPGSFSGVDAYNVCVKVKDLKVETITVDSQSTTIIVSRGGSTQSYSVNPGQAVDKIIVFLNVLEVEVSTG